MGLEKMVGTLPGLRKALDDEHFKFKSLAHPEDEHRNLFKIFNPIDKQYEQVDLRLMPAYFVHRKLKHTISSVEDFLNNNPDQV
jgi:hypothetical protein